MSAHLPLQQGSLVSGATDAPGLCSTSHSRLHSYTRLFACRCDSSLTEDIPPRSLRPAGKARFAVLYRSLARFFLSIPCGYSLARVTSRHFTPIQPWCWISRLSEPGAPSRTIEETPAVAPAVFCQGYLLATRANLRWLYQRRVGFNRRELYYVRVYSTRCIYVCVCHAWRNARSRILLVYTYRKGCMMVWYKAGISKWRRRFARFGAPGVCHLWHLDAPMCSNLESMQCMSSFH